MHVSVGILRSASKLLERASRDDVSLEGFLGVGPSYYVASRSRVVDTLLEIGWAGVEERTGSVIILPRGLEVIGAASDEATLRVQLEHIISALSPPWAALLARGRKEAARYMSADVVQCFDEAGLLECANEDVARAWDRLSSIGTHARPDSRLETGRKGELLSIEYEERRTGKRPIWEALESNYSGYDLRSVVSADDRRPLLVEVKATQSRLGDGFFYLSKNEWLTATSSDEHVFHLWSLRSDPTLAVASADMLAPHLPCDGGLGEWWVARVPMSVASEGNDHGHIHSSETHG